MSKAQSTAFGWPGDNDDSSESDHEEHEIVFANDNHHHKKNAAVHPPLAGTTTTTLPSTAAFASPPSYHQQHHHSTTGSSSKATIPTGTPRRSDSRERLHQVWEEVLEEQKHSGEHHDAVANHETLESFLNRNDNEDTDLLDVGAIGTTNNHHHAGAVKGNGNGNFHEDEDDTEEAFFVQSPPRSTKTQADTFSATAPPLPPLSTGNTTSPSPPLSSTAALQRHLLFDPLASRSPRHGGSFSTAEAAAAAATTTSLLDTSIESTDGDDAAQNHTHPPASPPLLDGGAGFLEMEDVDEGRVPTANSPYDPIRTSSGLLLTHRRVPPAPKRRTTSTQHCPLGTLQMDDAYTASSSRRHGPSPRSTPSSYAWTQPPLQAARTLLRYARVWVLVSGLVLLTGTVLLVQHTASTRHGMVVDKQHEESSSSFHSTDETVDWRPLHDGSGTSGEMEDATGTSAATTTIVLLPLPPDHTDDKDWTAHHSLRTRQDHGRRLVVHDDETVLTTTEDDREYSSVVPPPPLNTNGGPPQQPKQTQRQPQSTMPQPHLSIPKPLELEESLRNAETRLRADFDDWVERHGKTYQSLKETQERFKIWAHNHHRTQRKNEHHGPCKLTGKQVFGSNHLQDLTAEEFAHHYLSGQHATARRQPLEVGQTAMSSVPVLSHDRVPPPSLKHDGTRRVSSATQQQHHRNVQERRTSGSSTTTTGMRRPQGGGGGGYGSYSSNCNWYDISCHLRYIFSTYLYGLGGTMEPIYNADSYPTSVDWRDAGAVSEVHSQGNCGACWAITAVETVESAYFMDTGELYDLAETEVIVCETNGEMCAGGWPQDAFEYVMDQGGLPLEEDMSYDGDWLLQISDAVAGDSDELDSSTVSSYQQSTCPAGGGSGDGVDGTNSYSRYGKIAGYGYSTEKCTCYTDGSGCDCDEQNEDYAIRNLATYGPAVVCLDASTWQDYTDGIITSSSGCSQGFMDVNHCVQAVGYAYMSSNAARQLSSDSGSGDSGDSNKSGSQSGSGDGEREGYWIIRNQWSSYWGMNGYAYVAMGENTCGILNDMMQAYT